MLNIRRNVTFSFIEVCSTLLLTFLSYRIVMHHGGVAALGVWSTLFAWLTVARLGDLGIGGAVTRFVSVLDLKEDTDRIRAYIDTAILTNAGILLLLTLASYAVLRHWLLFVVGAQYLDVAQAALPWMVIALIASNLSAITASSLVALHLGFIRSTIVIVGNLLQLAFVFLLVPRWGIGGFAMAQVIQFTFCTLAAWGAVCWALGRFALPGHFRMATLREMLGFSLTLQLSNIINGLFEPLSKILVSKFGGMHLQGLYEVAYKTVFTTRNIAATTTSATIPALTRHVAHDIEQARALYLVIKRRVTRALALLFGGLLIGAPLVSLAWFGSIDWAFIVIMAQLCIGIFASGWCTPAYFLGQATGKLRGLIVSMTASLLLLGLLGLAFGIAGLPNLIVTATTLALIVSSVMVVMWNEPLIGLGGRRTGMARARS